MYRTCNPFLDFWVSSGTWISGTTWLKPIWIISVVKFLSFTLTDIFLNTFSAKTSIKNQHPKTTSNQKKKARSKNTFEKVRKRAPKSKLLGTFCKLGRPNVTGEWGSSPGTAYLIFEICIEIVDRIRGKKWYNFNFISPACSHAMLNDNNFLASSNSYTASIYRPGRSAQ